MHSLVKHKEVFFSPDLPFKRSGFRNRMVLAGSSGPIVVSIPVIGGRSVHLPYNQVMIDYSSNWQRDHFRTLCTVYGRSPFFFHYREELEVLFQESPSTLFSWNLRCLQWVLTKAKIAGLVSFRSEAPFLNQHAEMLDLTDFYQPKTFNLPEKGPFLRYPQVFEDRAGFMPNLSIVDLLFNQGPEGCKKIVQF